MFILRVSQGKSPFKADRQHIHHRLLQLGCTHLQATLILISVNLFFIVLSYSLRGLGIIWLMGLILGLASLMSYILVTYAKRKRKEEINSVLSMYFAMQISKDRKILIGDPGNQPRRIHRLHPMEKVGAMMN